jgi:hypothetical protein
MPALALLWKLVVLSSAVVERRTASGGDLFADRSRRPSGVLGRDADQDDGGFERVDCVVLELPPTGHFVVVDDDPRVQCDGRLGRRSVLLPRGIAADGPLGQVSFGRVAPGEWSRWGRTRDLEGSGTDFR